MKRRKTSMDKVTKITLVIAGVFVVTLIIVAGLAKDVIVKEISKPTDVVIEQTLPSDEPTTKSQVQSTTKSSELSKEQFRSEAELIYDEEQFKLSYEEFVKLYDYYREVGFNSNKTLLLIKNYEAQTFSKEEASKVAAESSSIVSPKATSSSKVNSDISGNTDGIAKDSSIENPQIPVESLTEPETETEAEPTESEMPDEPQESEPELVESEQETVEEPEASDPNTNVNYNESQNQHIENIDSDTNQNIPNNDYGVNDKHIASNGLIIRGPEKSQAKEGTKETRGDITKYKDVKLH